MIRHCDKCETVIVNRDSLELSRNLPFHQVMSKETDHSITSSNIKIVDKKRLYFVHLNINDILTKVEQLRSLLINSNIFVLRKTETKVYNTVNNEEVATDGYNLIRPDRNRKG